MQLLISLVLLLASAVYPGTDSLKTDRVLAVTTNIPYDVTYIPGYGITSIPSLGVEYYPSGHGRFSYGLDLECPMWTHPTEHRYFQINNLTASCRWYFLKNYKGDYHGLFLYAGAGATRYGIGWDARGWQGEGVHISGGLGYKVALGKKQRFFLDMGLAGGFFYSRFDPYVWGNDATGWYYYDYNGRPEDFVERNLSLKWFGPTRVWISIGINLFNRKSK